MLNLQLSCFNSLVTLMFTRCYANLSLRTLRGQFVVKYYCPPVGIELKTLGLWDLGGTNRSHVWHEIVWELCLSSGYDRWVAERCAPIQGFVNTSVGTAPHAGLRHGELPETTRMAVISIKNPLSICTNRESNPGHIDCNGRILLV